MSHPGDASGESQQGTRIALINVDKRQKAEEMARKVEYVELAAEPDFQKHFIDALDFPHAKDSFPHLVNVLVNRAFPSEAC